MLEVDDTSGAERTTNSLIDGVVRFTNEHGPLLLGSHEQAVAEPGKPPARTPGFTAKNVLHWCFYYPAVLNLRDLSFVSDEVKESLTAYRQGDLL